MVRLESLLVQSYGSPLAPVQKLLEERGIDFHLTRSWQEVEKAYTLLPLERIKYILVDMTLCEGTEWTKFLHRTRIASSGTAIICFHPQSLHGLHNIFGPTTTLNPNDTEVPPRTPLIEGGNPKFREILKLANRYAKHNITVLITGETGTGKELIARYIHEHSPRKDKSLVACNMTAIPETLVESELFGYVKGAFTGADKNKRGLIEAAEGGTLFLDEVGDLPPAIQLKLLRFLESREYYRVGDSSPKTADVRIIAATNKDLDDAMLQKAFRKDLYYRLNSARVILPLLRERSQDIMPLATNFTHLACRQTQKAVVKISSSVKALLIDYSWPGNIRELKSVIESAVMVSDGEYLTLGDLPMHMQQYATNHREEIGAKAIRNLESAERKLIEESVKEANGNKAKAAKFLGISTRTLYRKLEKFAASRAA